MDELDLDSPPPLPRMRDGRTPEELVEDGDHRWPPDRDGVRRVYLPPHLAGRARRVFLRRLLTAEAVLESPDAERARRAAWRRAGGDVACGQCGEKLYDHPRDAADGCLTVLCDRSRVKL